MCRRARAALLALLGACFLASVAAAPAGAAPAEDPNNVTFAVQLEADGDATWTVRATFDLETAAERSAFEAVAADYRSGQSRSLGLDAFRNASQEAARSTGREMRIVNPARSASPASAIRNGTGWLSLSFTWTNFAAVREDEDIVVGDAFNTTSGTWLAGLGPDQTLVVTPPESHNPFAGDGVLSQRSFRWEGPRTFEPGSPRAEFTVGGTARPGDFTLPAVVVAALGGVLVVVFLVARRQDVFTDDPAAAADGSEAEPPDPSGPSADSEAADAELLSDEERVERLLEENGGRMKQATIVRETGWSNAKVSQLLSSMEDEGRVDKLRIGRENLISFPDEDVTDLE